MRSAYSVIPFRWAALLAACALLLGCDPSLSPPDKGSATGPEEKPKLRVLVIDDVDLAGAIREQWQVRAVEDELDVQTANSKELPTAKRLSADVVVFPARWMGELAERELIQPIPETMLPGAAEADQSSLQLRINELLPTVRHCDVSWGRKPYAVTLGSPQLVLLYRPDIFAKLELSPPATWEDYQAALAKLADRTALGDLAPAEGQVWHAALEPTADGWAGTSLLARAASALRVEGQQYALFDVERMSARISSPPLVMAAREMAAAAKVSGVADRRLTPEQVRAAFFAGECGMAITWPSGPGAAAAKVPVAFAELPGRSESFSFKTNEWSKKAKDADMRTSLCGVAGRMAAVTREARRSRAAFALLEWLGSDEASRALGAANPQTTLSTRSQLTNPTPWMGEGVPSEAAASYAQVAEAAFSRSLWMPVVRLPGVDAYHAALDVAVMQTLADPDQAEASLATAAQAWDEITKRHDLARQRRAYQRSLGNDF